MITHDTRVRVRYGEVDRMGFLYHSHYVELFDVGRSELMREVGIPNVKIEDAGIMLPVLKVDVNYRNPAYYDDLLIVRTSLAQMPGVKIKFDYEVFRTLESGQEGECITTGSVTLAFMHADTKRACRPPQALIEILEPYFTGA